MHDFRGKLPALLLLVALAIFAYSIVHQLRPPLGPRAVEASAFMGAYLLWMLAEARITFGEAKAGPSASDRGSLELYGLARLAVIAATCLVPRSGISPSGTVLAFGVFVGGVALRLWAIRELGRLYSHRVRIAADHAVVQAGPYRWIRHPSYAGMLLAHAGFVGFFANTWSVALLCGLLAPAIVRRIHVEERALHELAGYVDYSRSRSRLLPFVW